jgi:hypothetical protein
MLTAKCPVTWSSELGGLSVGKNASVQLPPPVNVAEPSGFGTTLPGAADVQCHGRPLSSFVTRTLNTP